MERIESFQVDHNRLMRGLYVSRKDSLGSEWVTTFDIRMKQPNEEPVLDVPAMHSIEHIGATWLRNHPTLKEETIYFGPMGCRTGFYLILKGNLESKSVLKSVQDLFEYVAASSLPIPGGTAIECGNYLSHDLPMAIWESRRFLEDILNNIKEENLVYPKN